MRIALPCNRPGWNLALCLCTLSCVLLSSKNGCCDEAFVAAFEVGLFCFFWNWERRAKLTLVLVSELNFWLFYFVGISTCVPRILSELSWNLTRIKIHKWLGMKSGAHCASWHPTWNILLRFNFLPSRTAYVWHHVGRTCHTHRRFLSLFCHDPVTFFLANSLCSKLKKEKFRNRRNRSLETTTKNGPKTHTEYTVMHN